MLAVTRLFLKVTALTLVVICLTGFSPYTTVTVTIVDVEDSVQSLEAVRQIIRELGYTDVEVSYPTGTESGFRSKEPKGIFIILDFNASKKEIELSFSQYSVRLTKAAEEQLARLTGKLRDYFKDKAVSISGR